MNKLLELAHNYTGTDDKECTDLFFRTTIEHLSSRPTIDLDVARAWLKIVYDKKPVPGVVIASPKRAFDLTGQTSTHAIGIGRLEQLVWYAAGFRFGDKPETHPEIIEELTFCTQVWDVIACEELCVLIPYPDEVYLNDDSRFHRDGAPALVWHAKGDDPGHGLHYRNGRPYPSWVHQGPTKELLEGVRNAEKRRMIQEILGADRVIEILGLKPTDAATIDGLKYELFSNETHAWLRMQSPPLHDGSQPTYTEPVHEQVESCAEALGWRATGRLGVSVKYGHQA